MPRKSSIAINCRIDKDRNDIIVTTDDRYVFLEVNPVGEFFWLELYAGLPISQAIADLLLTKS